jgi:feruloyl esterase
MPSDTWNGKFEAMGNGGWAGQISVQLLAQQLGRGYAVAMTDTGHTGQGGDGSFAFNHPEKVIDFATRAVHEMTVDAKAVIGAFYARPIARAYWNGCSTGGRQGLKEAQAFPGDFDGISAGAPANDMTDLMASSIWIAQASAKTPGNYIPPAKYPVIHQAAIAACDALDGVVDGVLEDPRQCSFDPMTIQCTGDDGPACLTAAQVETARAIYAPATNPRTHAEIFPGLERGSEMGWSGQAGPAPLSIANDYYRFIIFNNPSWDFRTLDFDRDLSRPEALDPGGMDATNPDLHAFVAHGGRLLLFHGWNDQLIAPRNTVRYYERVAQTMGGAERIADSIRLFMMPGATHCGGGDGPSNFDQMDVIDAWVDRHQAPARIVAAHLTGGVVDRTRPLCAYPQVAVYRGTGDTNDAANFSCSAK